MRSMRRSDRWSLAITGGTRLWRRWRPRKRGLPPRLPSERRRWFLVRGLSSPTSCFEIYSTRLGAGGVRPAKPTICSRLPGSMRTRSKIADVKVRLPIWLMSDGMRTVSSVGKAPPSTSRGCAKGLAWMIANGAGCAQSMRCRWGGSRWSTISFSASDASEWRILFASGSANLGERQTHRR